MFLFLYSFIVKVLSTILSSFIFSILIIEAQPLTQLEQLSKSADSFVTKNFDTSLQLSFNGLIKSEQHKDSVYTGYFLGLIGKAYYFKGEYDSAALYFSKSVQILERKNEGRKFASIATEYAKLYRKIKLKTNQSAD